MVMIGAQLGSDGEWTCKQAGEKLEQNGVSGLCQTDALENVCLGVKPDPSDPEGSLASHEKSNRLLIIIII